MKLVVEAWKFSQTLDRAQVMRVYMAVAEAHGIVFEVGWPLTSAWKRGASCCVSRIALI